MKKYLINIVVLLITLSLILGIGEACVGFWNLNPPPLAAEPPHNSRELDAHYGWKVQEGYQYKGTLRDEKDTPYSVAWTSKKYGFRSWGNPASPKKKVLFVGDSYVHCVEVSEGKTFYDLLGDSLDMEIFAVGAAGWGHTQEWMMVKDHIKEIKPDLVVWVWCGNDWIDNYWELENQSDYKVKQRRPYWVDNQIEYHHPLPYPENVKRYSGFLYWIANRIHENKRKYDTTKVVLPGQNLLLNDANHPMIQTALKITDGITAQFQKEIPPQTKLMIVSVDKFSTTNAYAQKIAQKYNIDFYADIHKTLEEAKSKGEAVYAWDGWHWNERGHKIAADALVPIIKNKF